MIGETINLLLRYSVHGGALKALALASRAVFLVLAIPHLLQGELAVYVYVNSLSLVLAALIIVGLNEELPRQIAGETIAASKYLFWAFALSICAAGAFLLTLARMDVASGVMLFTLTLATGRFLGGVTRSVNIRLFEFAQNLPWVIFIIVVLLLQPGLGIQLIVIMAACMIAVYWGAMAILLVRNDCRISFSTRMPAKALFQQAIDHGSSRLMSNLFMLGFVRGVVLWPVWLSVASDADEFAFLVAAGGVVSQFGVIPVNRMYAKWCIDQPVSHEDWALAARLAILLPTILFAISAAVAWGILLLELMPPQASNFGYLVQALVFFSLLPSFYLMRYLLWSRALLARTIVSITAVMFFFQGCIVYFLPAESWIAWSVLLMLAMTVYLAVVSKSKLVR